MAPLPAECHLALAEVLRQGQPELRGEHLLRAKGIIATLGANGAAPRAQPSSG